ncbi:hypothetical protein [Paracoccus laeviglucosivorans]|uniref:hypothetical protein n=1 Tax=Paracoccus laeviglucosivorans TaxID=1197861 RepID=UPI00163DE4C1|nr:hypothetical protein [Paracoccus laeviglucosivorans]
MTVKLHDKLAAIEKLMRHLGMFAADNKQAVDGLTQLIMAAHGTAFPLSTYDRAMSAS